MKAKYFSLLFFLFFCKSILLPVYAQSTKESWNGWRGLEKEGRYIFSSAPVTWSETENIFWKTTIPGKGHSSPVAEGNNIFVTSAYHISDNEQTSIIVDSLIIIFSFLLLIIFLWKIAQTLIRKDPITIEETLLFWVLSFTFGFILYYSHTGIIFAIADNADHITQSTRWYFSGMIAALCLFAASYTLEYTNRNKAILIILSIILSGCIWIFRPAPEYYTLIGDGSLAYTIINAGVIPLLFAFILLLTFFIIKIPIHQFSEPKHNNFTLYKKSIFLIGLTCAFGLGLFGIVMYRFLRFSIPAKDFSIPSLDIYYRDSNVFTGIIFTCFILVSALILIKSYYKITLKSHLFAIGIVCLALCVFIKKNYFTIQNEFVRALICIDTETGKTKWIKHVFKGYQANLHHDNSPASPTPIVIGNRVFAYFGSPGLLCADTTGNIIWENKNLPFEDIHGIGASPMYADGLIIILNDMPKDPYITAIDSKNGKLVWIKKRMPWEGFHGAHRTLTIIQINSKKVILAWGFNGLQGYDLQTGEELFSYTLGNNIGQLVASILSKGDTIFTPDLDSIHALRVSDLLNKNKPVIWSVKMKNKGPVCSSPVLFNNMIFTTSDNGYVHCIDAIKGIILWKQKLNGNYIASSTLINNKIYLSNTSGATTVIAAEDKFNKIAENILH